MAEFTQLSMDEVLNPKPAEPLKEPVKVEIVETKETEPKIEKPISRRRAWEEKEQLAKGRVKDPETDQYVAKQEKEEELKKETKEDIKQEVKEEVKVEKVEVKEKPVAQQQELTDKEKAFMRGMEEERRKRQAAERERDEARAKIPATPTEPAKTFWDDPEGALEKQRAEIRTEIINTRLNTAELIARRDHPDFDEKIAVFGEILQKTPGLHSQWINSPNPAEFAYGIGKTHMELQQAGSIDKLREKIEKETRIKLEAELKEKAEKLALERAAIPPSLSEAPSKGTNKPVWSGPTPMDAILKP